MPHIDLIKDHEAGVWVLWHRLPDLPLYPTIIFRGAFLSFNKP